MNTPHAIDGRNLMVSYPSNEEPSGQRIILNNVNLKVQPGELVTVVGPSGCGKSTLLRLVLGSQKPNAGSMLVDGNPVTRITGDCGIVYQTYWLYPHLTVRENVALGPFCRQTNALEWLVNLPLSLAAKFVDYALLGMIAARGPASVAKEARETPEKWMPANRLLKRFRYHRVLAECCEQANELIAQCGLDPVKDGDKYPFELSGGMRQRVAIAQALICKPKVLLMDEPFGALDPITRQQMCDLVHDLWQKNGVTIFFVTHELEEACKLGTRLICLSQYWQGSDGKQGPGARILIDKPVSGGAQKPSAFEESDQFNELVAGIKPRLDKKSKLVKLADFELSHADACKPSEQGETA